METKLDEMHSLSRITLFCAIAIVASIGCASGVKTTECAERPCRGDISYFLPKRLVRIDIEHKAVEPKEQAKVAAATAEAAQAAKDQALKDAKEAKRAASLAQNPAGAGAGAAAVQADLALRQATHSLAVAQQAQVTAQEAVQLLHAARVGAGCVFVLELAAEPVIPDTSQRFMLSLSHQVMNDDDLKIQTSETGLLKSLSATSTDRTGDVLVEIAKAAAQVAKLVAGFPPGAVPVVRADGAPGCDEYKERHYVDPSDRKSVAVIQARLAARADGPQLIVEDLTTPCEVGEVIGTTKDEAGKDVPVYCGVNKERIAIAKDKHLDGLLHRRSAPFRVALHSPPGAAIEQTIAIVATVPDPRTDALMTIQSGNFVTRTYAADFTDGALTRLDQNEPSEVQGFATIPNRVLAEIVSIPTDLLQLKVDYSSKERSIVENQKALLEAQQKIQEIQGQMNSSATTLEQ